MWNIRQRRNNRHGIASFGIRQPYLPGDEFRRRLSALQERGKSVGVRACYFSIIKHDQIDFKSHFHYLPGEVARPACFDAE